jgi:hypothetical protein
VNFITVRLNGTSATTIHAFMVDSFFAIVGACRVSVWPHMNEIDIISLKTRLMRELDGKGLYFFSSETHPLGLPRVVRE